MKPLGHRPHPNRMITCRTFVEFLADYMSRELPDTQRDEFDRHLAACVACVAYMKSYGATIQLARILTGSALEAVPARTAARQAAAKLVHLRMLSSLVRSLRESAGEVNGIHRPGPARG